MLTAAVVVLGDLARSPRMRAHAEALAAAGWRVALIGYVEGDAPAIPGVDVVAIADPVGARGRVWWMALRLVTIAVGLWRALARVGAGAVLVQIPPALPTLPVARLWCWWSGARLVVDWHNFGWAMLRLKLGDGVPVTIAGWMERVFARGASGHLCVTGAMRARLAEWGVDARVLPDLPRPVGWTREAARARLAELVPLPRPDARVVVTATSWTLDEDHELLVRAVDACAARGSPGAAVVLVYTGRGPGRAAFERAMANRSGVFLRWVAEVDYRAILRGADAGVCLHRSASGVDFPMKIVDMRAAGLPVLALDYGPALHEGFREGLDGCAFRDVDALSNLLDRVVAGPEIRVEPVTERWQERWDAVALEMLTGSWPGSRKL